MGNYSYHRSVRIAKLVQAELAECWLQGRVPNLGPQQLIIQNISIQAHFSTIEATVTILPGANLETVEQTLNQNISLMRKYLAQKLQLRSMPRLRFHCLPFGSTKTE
mgnify:CR=1 FL=1|jgi:ribosome-binding factor A